MQDFLHTAARSLIAIVFLFLLGRFIGKKQMSQLTFFDYTMGISIGSVAASFAVDPSIGYLHGITSMLVFTLAAVAFYITGLKSYRARKLLDGTPAILIQNGKINEKNLKKSKLSINDLLEECRLKNAFNIQDVEFAIFETSGELSILMKAPHLPLTAQDMNIQTVGKGICTNLVVDGKILYGNLAVLGLQESWLCSELEKMGIASPSMALLCTIDSTGQLFADQKNADRKTTPVM